MAVKGDTGLKRRGRSVSDDGRRREKPENKAGLSVVQGQRKRRGLTVFRVFARLAVVSLAIAAGVFIYSRWDKIQPENILLWLNDKLAGGESGDGFPFEITGSSVIGMESTRDGLALLTNNSLVLLNSKGGEIYRRPHGFNPMMRAGGRWILVADSGGNRAELESRLSTAVEMTVKNKITSVDVSDKGLFCGCDRFHRRYLRKWRFTGGTQRAVFPGLTAVCDFGRGDKPRRKIHGGCRGNRAGRGNEILPENL